VRKGGWGPGATGQTRMLAGMFSRSFALSRMSDRDAKTIPNCRERAQGLLAKLKSQGYQNLAMVMAHQAGSILFFITSTPRRKFLGPYGFPTVESWYPNRIWFTAGF
jgi:hypothetical protein